MKTNETTWSTAAQANGIPLKEMDSFVATNTPSRCPAADTASASAAEQSDDALTEHCN